MPFFSTIERQGNIPNRHRHAKSWYPCGIRFSGLNISLLGKVKPLSRMYKFLPVFWKAARIFCPHSHPSLPTIFTSIQLLLCTLLKFNGKITNQLKLKEDFKSTLIYLRKLIKCFNGTQSLCRWATKTRQDKMKNEKCNISTWQFHIFLF